MDTDNPGYYGSILDKVLDWSHRQNYQGYSKHDGLNSPILFTLAGWSKWLRLIAIQAVMRSPVNLRPVLLVPGCYNPKGLALFSQAYIDKYHCRHNDSDLGRARNLLDLLVEIRSRGDWSGYAWGYHYPWQDTGFYAPAKTPNAVVSSFVCEAFLDAFRATGDTRYLDVVGKTILFFLNDLPVLKENEFEMCLAYMPLPMHMRVMDVSILVGSVISQYASLTNEDELMSKAVRLIRYVINQQTEYGAWYYTDPPSASHITHDNYHTGFILDALWRHMEASGDWQWLHVYQSGLKFYRDRLFTGAGAPRWMHDREHPYDIHGAAQGILTFSRHDSDHPGVAGNILRWTVENMYMPEGRFIYQIHGWYRKKYTLLRWCNAWMCRAIARFLLLQHGYEHGDDE